MHIRIFARLIIVVCFKWYAALAVADVPPKTEDFKSSGVGNLSLRREFSCGLYARLELMTGHSVSNSKGLNLFFFRGQGWGLDCQYRRGNWGFRFSEGLRSENLRLHHWQEKWMGNLSVSAKGFETMLGVGWFFENWDFWAEAAKQEVSVDKWAVNRLGVVIHNETLDFTDFANQHLDLQVGLDIWKLRVKGGRQINSRVHLALGVEWGMLQPKGSLAADELAAKALKHARVDLQGTTEKLRGVINLPVVVPEVHIRGGRWVISTKLLWNYLAQEDWICGAEVKWSLSF